LPIVAPCLLQVRGLLCAGAAPARPEVHHDDLPAQVGERDRLAVVRLQREVRRFALGRLGGERVNQPNGEENQHRRHNTPDGEAPPADAALLLLRNYSFCHITHPHVTRRASDPAALSSSVYVENSLTSRSSRATYSGSSPS